MMTAKINRGLLITASIAIMLAILALAGCSSATKDSVPKSGSLSSPEALAPDPVQSSSGGAVTLEAKLLGHQEDTLVFEVSMNTHSVNLDSYNLKELAVLRDDRGIEYRPSDWGSVFGGHHRKGRLAFTHSDQSARSFELVIRDVAGIKERVLKWG